MDLGCGKGGDLKKYNYENRDKKEKISNYVGVDISIRGLRDAIIRKVKSAIDFPAVFVCMGGETEPEQFAANLPQHTFFDIVSAQFCIHYFFGSERNVRNFLQNVSAKLTKNGFFIATFPDAEVIMKKLENGKFENDAHIFDSKYYALMMQSEDAGKETPYGIKYGFFLDDGLIGDLSR